MRLALLEKVRIKGQAKMKKKIVIGILLSIILVTIVVKSVTRYEIIARYITNEHYRYSPVVLYEKLYFPSDFMKEHYENTQGIGFLGHKDAGLINDSLLITGLIEVDKNDSELISFIVRDDLSMDYLKADFLNNIDVIYDILNKYSNFVLCKDTKGKETRIPIKKEFLIDLISEFGEVTYNLDDYHAAEEIFYIYVDSPSEKIHDRTFDDPIVYLGTIFVQDNTAYYGNLQNDIEYDWVNTLNIIP